MTPERIRFEELLPFYASDTLSADDKAFVERFLTDNPQAQASMLFASGLKQAASTLVLEQPTSKREERFMLKLAQQKTLRLVRTEPNEVSAARTGLIRGWWFGITGLGMAGIAATLLLMPGLLKTGILHMDQLDGRPDVVLTLADNVIPSQEAFLENLAQFHAEIVQQTEEDGHYRVLVDLQNRSADQHRLIDAMLTSGQLQDYTVLAAR